MAKRVTSRVARTSDRETLFVQATRELIPLVRNTGTAVIVGHIDSEEQLSWWTAVGAETASGPLFGAAGPPEEIEELFS